MRDIWSYGGGTQSVAIAVLVAEGRLPRPERVVIADTGREDSVTWSYTQTHVAPLLARVGLVVEVAPHSLASVDLYGHNGDLLIPAFTTQSGTPGKLPTLCSTEWKKRVVARYLRHHGYGPDNPVRVWLGISVDELDRAKDSGMQWLTHHFPLLFDVPMRRSECIAVVERAGLPTPPKSSCWMCPHRSDRQWRDLRDHRPGDWEKAVAFDADLRTRDAHVFLHKSGVPLGEAELGNDDEQLSLLGECNSGFCFV